MIVKLSFVFKDGLICEMRDRYSGFSRIRGDLRMGYFLYHALNSLKASDAGRVERLHLHE